MTNTSAPPVKKSFSESMLYMWRSIILMAHADGVVHDKERHLFDRIFVKIAKAYDATPEQMQLLARDINEQQDFDEITRHVTDPEHKAVLVYFAQVVASIDGILAYDEASMIGRLQGTFGLKPDTEEVMKKIRAEISEQMQKRKSEVETATPREPIQYALDALLFRLGMERLD